jgi:hypothetical protein
MILIFFVINLFISILNAWGCGRTWDSTKAKGGGAHFMNWMGAIMACSGFTWCYMVVFGFVATQIPYTSGEGAEAVTAPLLDAASLQAFADLGYLVIIFPILGSGLAITISSWRALARRRSAGNFVVTGWNTFAQIHNTYNAVQAIPGVWARLGDFFGGKSSSSSSDGKGKIVVILVALAVLGGLLTTYGIIQATRRSVLVNESMRAA